MLGTGCEFLVSFLLTHSPCEWNPILVHRSCEGKCNWSSTCSQLTRDQKTSIFMNKCVLVSVYMFCLIHQVSRLAEFIEFLRIVSCLCACLLLPVFTWRRTHLRVRANSILIETKQVTRVNYWIVAGVIYTYSGTHTYTWILNKFFRTFNSYSECFPLFCELELKGARVGRSFYQVGLIGNYASPMGMQNTFCRNIQTPILHFSEKFIVNGSNYVRGYT